MTLVRGKSWWLERPGLAHRAAVALCRRGLSFASPGALARHAEDVAAFGLLAPGRRPPLHPASFPAHCPVCGCPRFWGGDWRPAAGRNNRADAVWHTACVAANLIWTKPDVIAWRLAERQGWRCAESGEPVARLRPGRHPPHDPEWTLVAGVEVDHRIPLWRARELGEPWPDVLRHWGPANLRVLTKAAHAAKTGREARDLFAMRAARARRRAAERAQRISEKARLALEGG